MAGNDLGIVDIQAGQLRADPGDVLVARAVGAVTADAVLLIVLVGKAVHEGVGRHRLVEGRVEGDDLRDRREHGLHGTDAQQVRRIVERGEIAAEVDLLQDVVVHEDGTGEEIAALDDAVADRLDVLEGSQDARLGIRQRLQDQLHAHPVVRDGKILHDLLASGRSVLEDTGGKADLFRDTFGDDVENVVVLHIQQLVLDGRTATIDD